MSELEPTLVAPEAAAELESQAIPESVETTTPEGQGAPETQEPETKAESPALTLAQMARKLGFGIDESLDDTAVASALNDYRQLASEGYRVRSAQPVQQPQQPVAQPAQQPQQEDPWSKAWVPIDQTVIAQCKYDEATGTYVGKTEFTPPHIVLQANQMAAEFERRQKDFWQNPYKATYDSIREPLLNEIRQELRRELQQQQYESQKQAFEQEIAAKYYATDESGNYLANPQTGDYATTPWAGAYSQMMQQLVSTGATDELAMARMAAQHADAVTAAQKPAAPATPPATPAQVSQQKKDAFLSGAVNGATGSGGFGASHESVQEPVNLTEAELENFFIDRGRLAGLM